MYVPEKTLTVVSGPGVRRAASWLASGGRRWDNLSSRAGMPRRGERAHNVEIETQERADTVRSPTVPPLATAKLFASRTVLLLGEITSALAERTTSLLLALAAESD